MISGFVCPASSSFISLWLMYVTLFHCRRPSTDVPCIELICGTFCFVSSLQRCALFLLPILFILLTQFQTTICMSTSKYLRTNRMNALSTLNYQLYVVCHFGTWIQAKYWHSQFSSTQCLASKSLHWTIYMWSACTCALSLSFDLKSTLQISAEFKWHTQFFRYFFTFVFICFYKKRKPTFYLLHVLK